MQLDGATLFVALTMVMALGGLLLLWGWRQARRVKALKWWATAYLVGSLGTALLGGRGLLPDRLTIDLANALIFVGYGLMWNGARAFALRPPVIGWSLAPVGIWLLACLVPEIHGSLAARATVVSLLCCVVMPLIAWEFWRIREPLPSRLPLVAVNGLHGLFFLARMLMLMVWPLSLETWTTVWLPLTGLFGIVYMFVSGFLLLGLAKSHVEQRYRLASEQDYLTSAANRRGFYKQGERQLARARATGAPSCLLVFDMVGFKQVNDALGHQAGDRLLQLFGTIAQANLRRSDVFGRLGGDEFAALLADTTMEEAQEIAERIKVRFSDASHEIGGANLRVTASLGLASSPNSQARLDELIEQADRALYLGRRAG